MKKLIFLALVLCLAVSAQAGYLTWGTEVVAVSSGGQYSANLGPETVVNGNGLTGMEHGIGWDDGTMWLSDTSVSVSDAHGGNIPDWITIELDQPRLVDKLHIWNYNEGPNPAYAYSGAKLVEIWATDTVDGYSVPADLAFVGDLQVATAQTDYTGYDLVFDTPILMKELSIEVYTNWNGATGPIGLSEVWVHEVPEPATIALLGLGGLALIRRKK